MQSHLIKRLMKWKDVSRAKRARLWGMRHDSTSRYHGNQGGLASFFPLLPFGESLLGNLDPFTLAARDKEFHFPLSGHGWLVDSDGSVMGGGVLARGSGVT
jgi:hypothetical protein